MIFQTRRLYLSLCRYSASRRKLLCLIILAIFFLLNLSFWNDTPKQTVEGCNCTRPFHWPPPTFLLFPPASTCNDPGTFYQTDQNVISFSLHLNPRHKAKLRPLYVEGLELNLKAALELYPNFTLRIYTDYRLTPEDPFCPLLCLHSHVFWCDVHKIPEIDPKFTDPRRLMLWRSLPLGDPTVDVFLSRDLDSLISSREAAAVWDWLGAQETPRGIHVMRDHSRHWAVIMGGMWGARNPWLEEPETLQKLIIIGSKLLERNKHFNDQHVLHRVLYRLRKEDILAHDSYHCLRTSYQDVWIPFPVRRRGPEPGGGWRDFVGNTGLGRDVYKFGPCPVSCRPDYGQDWEYC